MKLSQRGEKEKKELLNYLTHVERQAVSLGLSTAELVTMAGLKPAYVAQLRWRAKKGHIGVLRPSTKQKLNQTIKDLKQKHQPDEPKVNELLTETPILDRHVGLTKEQEAKARRAIENPFMTLLTDDDIESIQSLPPPARVPPPTTGHQALVRIIQDKLSAMSLVQLALLLAHMEEGK